MIFKTIFWKGTHSDQIKYIIAKTWECPDQLLILCPPRIEDVSAYLDLLPEGEIEYLGDWKDKKNGHNKNSVEYSQLPSFGLFSTGTTDPSAKLILFSNKNISASNRGIMNYFKKLDVSSVFCYPRPYHIFGLSLGYLLCLEYDLELYFNAGDYSKDDHRKFIEIAKERGENLLTLFTPTHALDLIDYSNNQKILVPKSLTCILGGAKVSTEHWDKANRELNIDLPSIGYGCTEASPGVCHLAPGERPKYDGDLGTALSNIDIEIIDEGLLVRGENICLAIIQNDKIHFSNDEYKMLDKLSTDDKKHYRFIGRHELVLNRGGEKFSLEEIELFLKEDLNLDSVAISLNHDRLGQELALVIVAEEDKRMSVSRELKNKYKRNFDNKKFIFVNKLPINANAKVDRTVCAALFTELR